MSRPPSSEGRHSRARLQSCCGGVCRQRLMSTCLSVRALQGLKNSIPTSSTGSDGVRSPGRRTDKIHAAQTGDRGERTPTLVLTIHIDSPDVA
eukprot:1735407-Prymnesium_polylepis.1